MEAILREMSNLFKLVVEMKEQKELSNPRGKIEEHLLFICVVENLIQFSFKRNISKSHI